MSKKYYGSPLSVTSQFYFCPMPLRLDTYIGCVNQCCYCFANNSTQRNIADLSKLKNANEHCSEMLKPTKIEYIKKYFDIAFEGQKNTFSAQESAAIEAIKRRVPIHFGGMSDAFQPLERTERITLKTLQLLKKYNYPVIISTKCKLIAEEPYKSLILDYENCGIQVSLIDNRQEVANILEPGLGPTSIADRLHILETYKDKWTAVRIQPLIIKLTEPILEDFVRGLKQYKVNHILAEGLKFMSGNNLVNESVNRAFKKVSGESLDLLAYYKAIGSKHSGNDIELPSWRKHQYIKVLKKVCEETGITFGAADNDWRMEGDNPCCCGNKDMPGMENTIKHNIGYAAFRAREQGVPISYELIKDEWFFEGSMRVIASKEKILKIFEKEMQQDYSKLNPDNMTFEEYKVKHITDYYTRTIRGMFDKEWKKAGKNSPCQMCSVRETCTYDNEGKRIYALNTQDDMKPLKKNLKFKTLMEF